MKRRVALLTLICMAFTGPNLFSYEGRSIQMKKEIKTEKAPKAIGPYSQAIVANGFIFASGQIPIDPSTGKLFDKVVKCTVFLQDMDDFSRMNAVYGEFFKPPYPARAAVQVARLPKDVKVEIEAIAIK